MVLLEWMLKWTWYNVRQALMLILSNLNLSTEMKDTQKLLCDLREDLHLLKNLPLASTQEVSRFCICLNHFWMTECMYILKFCLRKKSQKKYFYVYFVFRVILRLKNQRLRTRRSWRLWDWRAPEREIRRVTAQSSLTAVLYVLVYYYSSQWYKKLYNHWQQSCMYCVSVNGFDANLWQKQKDHWSHWFYFIKYWIWCIAIIFFIVCIKVKAFKIRNACKVVKINIIFLFTWPNQWSPKQFEHLKS